MTQAFAANGPFRPIHNNRGNSILSYHSNRAVIAEYPAQVATHANADEIVKTWPERFLFSINPRRDISSVGGQQILHRNK